MHSYVYKPCTRIMRKLKIKTLSLLDEVTIPLKITISSSESLQQVILWGGGVSKAKMSAGAFTNSQVLQAMKIKTPFLCITVKHYF